MVAIAMSNPAHHINKRGTACHLFQSAATYVGLTSQAQHVAGLLHTIQPQNRLLFVAQFPAKAPAALGLAFLGKMRRGATWQDTPCTAGTGSCALQAPG